MSSFKQIAENILVKQWLQFIVQNLLIKMHGADFSSDLDLDGFSNYKSPCWLKVIQWFREKQAKCHGKLSANARMRILNFVALSEKFGSEKILNNTKWSIKKNYLKLWTEWEFWTLCPRWKRWLWERGHILFFSRFRTNKDESKLGDKREAHFYGKSPWKATTTKTTTTTTKTMKTALGLIRMKAKKEKHTFMVMDLESSLSPLLNSNPCESRLINAQKLTLLSNLVWMAFDYVNCRCKIWKKT